MHRPVGGIFQRAPSAVSARGEQLRAHERSMGERRLAVRSSPGRTNV